MIIVGLTTAEEGFFLFVNAHAARRRAADIIPTASFSDSIPPSADFIALQVCEHSFNADENTASRTKFCTISRLTCARHRR